LGYAGLNGEQTVRAIAALQATFQDLARSRPRRNRRA